MRRLLTLSLLITASALHAQKAGRQLLDSLLPELPKAHVDTGKVLLYSAIAQAYADVDPGRGIQYAGEELTLAQKLGWKEGQASAYIDLATEYANRSDNASALPNYFKALNIYDSLHDEEGVHNVCAGIGQMYMDVDNTKAEQYLFRALKISAKNNSSTLPADYLNVGYMYALQHRYADALPYALKGTRIYEKSGSSFDVALAYSDLGLDYAGLGEYSTSLSYLFKALPVMRDAGDKQHYAAVVAEIGKAYLGIAKDTAAIVPGEHIPAGRKENLANAVKYLDECMKVCREIQLYSGIAEFAPLLAEAYTMQGNYKAALDITNERTMLSDSLFDAKSSAKVASIESARDMAIKDKDIQIAQLELRQKRNERWLYVAGIAVSLIITVILFRNFRVQRRSNKLLAVEKDRSEGLLLNILPQEVAEELKQTGSATARQFTDVSVLFTDFVGFTRIADALGPQKLVQELHECFTAFDHIMVKYGLEKIKTIGDAYLAVCGLPAQNKEHAYSTVKAALEIRDFMARRGTFGIRIGINSGTVVAGIVGVKKFAYDVWGDAVNVAARMEQNSEPGRINISQNTYDLISQRFSCTYRGEIMAKNKGALNMYFVEKEMELAAV